MPGITAFGGTACIGQPRYAWLSEDRGRAHNWANHRRDRGRRRRGRRHPGGYLCDSVRPDHRSGRVYLVALPDLCRSVQARSANIHPRCVEAELLRGMTTKILDTPSDSQDLIRRAAFRLLLAHSAPIDVDQLTTATGISTERLSWLLDELDGAGRIRRDESGRVIGSAGLSVIPDRHQIELDGRRFWTWC